MSVVHGLTVATALLATTGSTLSVYPHQLAYFNELAGGPENGYKHLLHSNLDWGQDLFHVDSWVFEQHFDPREVLVSVCAASGPLCESSSKGWEYTSAIRWEIVSSNEALKPQGPWQRQLREGSAKRVGYTAWVFSVD